MFIKQKPLCYSQDKRHTFTLVKTNQGAKKVLFPNTAFLKFNNVYCEIMRASISQHEKPNLRERNDGIKSA